MTTTTSSKFRRIAIVAGVLAVALLVAGERRAASQAQPTQLTVAIYAPSAGFASSADRLTYVQGLAKAIEKKTGIPTKGAAYVSFADVLKAKPDFAIVDGQCVAAKSPGTLLATASIDGSTQQSWALFSRGDNLAALKGKKLAVIHTGCRDEDFVDNAMFESEVAAKGYFSALVNQIDAAGAIAAVRDYKKADAVFAPTSAGRGLTRLFDAGGVPNPGFVQVNKGIPSATAALVKDAVLSYGASGGIDGWKPAAEDLYKRLAGRMGDRVKRPIFAMPEVVRVEDQDVLIIPNSEYAEASVKQHFWEPPARRP